MNEKDIIAKGYFPKELPPQFVTYPLANNLTTVNNQWKIKQESLRGDRKRFFSETKSTLFNIPKVSFTRRTLCITNPIHQVELVKLINTRWAEIESIFNLSTSSYSIPVKDPNNRRAYVPKHSFGDFKRDRFIKSFDNYYEVKTDISKFYASIYTHSIPWLIHTKPVAKNRREDMDLLGNIIDKVLRKGNSGQTVGIPTGPDTSLIISEIINCKIDEILQNKFNDNNIKFFRFIDDIYIYCDSYTEAEKAFKFYQKTLSDFQLDINEEKTSILRTPFVSSIKWSIELTNFKFRKSPKLQIIDLERFVNLSLEYSKQNSKESVLLYSIQILKNIVLYSENWDFYESVILKLLLTEPRTIDVVAQILCSNATRVSISKLRKVLNKMIENHTMKGHNFEVAWALTLCKEFKIKLKNTIAKLILNSNDFISILIILDLKKNNLINVEVDTDFLNADLIEDNLINEYWLFTYEAIYKNWLTPSSDILKENEFFKILKDNGVYFYDETAKIPTYHFKFADTIDIDSPKVEIEYITSKQIFTGETY